MKRLRCLLALPALLIATSGPLMAAEIKDKAGLFSQEAVKKALSELDRVEREYKVPVTIEVVKSLEGDPIGEVTTRHARQSAAKGMYVLIAKDDHKAFAEVEKSYRSALTRDRLNAVVDAFDEQFKKKEFDAGLLRGVAKIESTVAEARPAANARRAAQAPVAGRPASGGLSMWLTIGLGILALLIVIRILGALFSGGNRGYAGQNRMMGPGGMGGGPGYGQPGYGGGGGGGFMSSMFGGIGGALAGNWLYDQFSGRHHDTSMGQSNLDPNAGNPADASPEWGGGGAEGDWGGGGADAGGGGGDWGGGGDAGGGGDWGGGGGG